MLCPGQTNKQANKQTDAPRSYIVKYNVEKIGFQPKNEASA